jgi:hypothetical protein
MVYLLISIGFSEQAYSTSTDSEQALLPAASVAQTW